MLSKPHRTMDSDTTLLFDARCSNLLKIGPIGTFAIGWLNGVVVGHVQLASPTVATRYTHRPCRFEGDAVDSAEDVVALVAVASVDAVAVVAVIASPKARPLSSLVRGDH